MRSRLLMAGVLCLLVTACASAPRIGERIGDTLQGIGLMRGEDGAHATETSLRLRMHAASNLNGGSEAQPLALVVKLFHLRDQERFLSMPFEAFIDDAMTDDALHGELLASREVLLLPNQRYDVDEALPPDARLLGVVALFRNPAGIRWRFVFDAGEVDANGILIGLHACAMTTTSPALLTRLGSPAHTLSATACPQANAVSSWMETRRIP